MRRRPAATAATKQFASGGYDEEHAGRRYRLHGNRSRRHKTATRRHRPQLQPSVSCPNNQCRRQGAEGLESGFSIVTIILLFTHVLLSILLLSLLLLLLLFLLFLLLPLLL